MTYKQPEFRGYSYEIRGKKEQQINNEISINGTINGFLKAFIDRVSIVKYNDLQ
jgi:hypothetical protein